MHYQRARLLGDVGEAEPRFMQKASVQERFWAKVEFRGDDECWEWLAGRFAGGYGQFSVDGSSRFAHRVSYEFLVGPIPQGLELDHLCRNTWCVNPAHLEPVTPRENKRRGFSNAALNARKTHCKRGHLLEGDNLKPDKRLGRRICRECANMHRRERYRRLGR